MEGVESLLGSGNTAATETNSSVEQSNSSSTVDTNQTASNQQGSDGALKEQASNLDSNSNMPDWFDNEKYESPEKQIEAWKSLEEKSANFVGAPEGDYEISMSEEMQQMIQDAGFEFQGLDHPLMDGMQGLAKELNLSGDALNKLMSKYVENQIKSQTVFLEQEKSQLGKDAPKIVNRINQWAQSNLSQDEMVYLQGATTTAAGVKFVESMLNRLQGEPNMSINQNRAPSFSQADLNAMLADPRYTTDKQYRDEVTKKFEQFYNR